MITAFGGGGGAFGGDSLGRGGGSGSGSTGDGGRSARWLRCDGDSPNLDGIHDASGSSSWPCSGGLLGEEARGGRSRSRALSLACAAAVERERPSSNVLLLGELLLPRPLGESQLISTIRASQHVQTPSTFLYSLYRGLVGYERLTRPYRWPHGPGPGPIAQWVSRTYTIRFPTHTDAHITYTTAKRDDTNSPRVSGFSRPPRARDRALATQPPTHRLGHGRVP